MKYFRGGISVTNPAGNNWFKVSLPDAIKHFNWSQVI